jgi:Domain of unknown function (DUF1772)
MLSGQLALISAAIFSGAAIYINVAEQPARLALDDAGLLTEWKLSYARAYTMQAGLALVSGVLAILAAWQAQDWRWLIGAACMLANGPWTFLVIMPTNRRLNDAAIGDAQSRARIKIWSGLHAVRSAFGLLAVAAYAWLLV